MNIYFHNLDFFIVIYFGKLSEALANFTLSNISTDRNWRTQGTLNVSHCKADARFIK